MAKRAKGRVVAAAVVSEVPASARVAAAVVSEAPANARAAVANAAVGTTSRMMASLKKYLPSTVRPRWLRAVAGSASAQW